MHITSISAYIYFQMREMVESSNLVPLLRHINEKRRLAAVHAAF